MRAGPAELGCVVVGAGLAGFRTIEALRRRGYDKSITLIGDEEHAPYDRPPLSKAVLAGKATDASVTLANAGRLAELQVRWLPGSAAIGLDTAANRVELADGPTLSYGTLVIATGAVPRRLPAVRSLGGVHVLRTLDDARAIRTEAKGAQRVCVLGGGVLGSEIAATLSQVVAEVTVVEAASSLLSRALPDGVLSAAVHRMHHAAGIRLLLGTKVLTLSGDQRVSAVETTDGSRLATDLVVVALGVTPAVEWLTGSGVELDNGVVCDEFLRASVPGVFAVGDVVNKTRSETGSRERVEHWTSAVEQADVVAQNIVGGTELVTHSALSYVWSDQFDRKLQLLGRPADADEEVVVGRDLADRRAFALYGSAGLLVGVVGLGTPKLLVRARRLLAGPTALVDALAVYERGQPHAEGVQGAT